MPGWHCAACAEENPDGTRFCGHCGVQRRDAASGPRAADITFVETPDEHRLITALFADISGYTTLADTLDPERLVDIIDPVLHQMGAIVERYQGRVVKFAGDAVLAFFGAPVAHEDDALRAVLCAQDMRRQIADLAATLPVEARHIQLHIGVNTGHAVAGMRSGNLDYAVLGDAVNVAQRLESMAGVGEILVGPVTHQLVGDALPFESAGRLSLKGKAEPVPAWRLLDAPDAVAVSQIARMPELVGRAAERSRLVDALGEIARGSARTLTVIGEPGVGKSRLLQDAARAAGELGILWLETRCPSYGAGLPYWPYADLLRRLAGITSDTSVSASYQALSTLVRDSGAVAALPYLAELTGAQPSEAEEGIPERVRRSPAALRRAIHNAVIDVVVGLVRRGPVVLAIEDVQWLDEASVELTQLLVTASTGMPLGVVATARPEASELALRLDPSTEMELVSLGRLSAESLAALAGEFLHGPVAEDVLDLLESRTDGNPLFVREVVRGLADTGALVRGPAGWRLAGLGSANVPTTIEAVLSARIDRLPRSAADALNGAAIVGRDVNVELLRLVVGDEHPPLATSLKILVDHGFMAEDRTGDAHTVQFTHALVRDVAYSRLVRRRRRDLHRQVVHAAMGLHGDGDEVIDLLAYHAYEGAMGLAGLTFVRRAANRAASLYANAEAIQYLRHALEMCGSDRADLGIATAVLLDLAQLHERVGAYDDALGAYVEAESLGVGVKAIVGQARCLITQGRYPDALGLLEDATQTCASSADTGMVGLERGHALASLGRHEESRAALELAVRALPQDDPMWPAAKVMLARVLQAMERPSDAYEHAQQAIAILEARGDLAELATALRAAGGMLSDLDRLEDAQTVLRRALEIARQTGNAEEEGAVLINLGVAHERLEQPDPALVCFSEALDVFERVGIRGGVAAAYCNLASVFSDLGRWEECLSVATAGLAVAEELGHTYWVTGALIGAAGAYRALGQWGEALAAAERCLAISEAAGMTERHEYAVRHLYAAQHRMVALPTVEELQSQDVGGPKPR